MTAQIAGFITRAEAGLRAPKSVSHNITPGSGGVALHYGGPATHIGSHDGCVRTWKAWQDFHMGPQRGWADIAYTMGVCDHGYAFAGRGAGVRTAAQGTNDGNQRYYAVVWLGGDGEIPTKEALNAFEWCVMTLRKAGAGNGVRPHKSFHTTSCPGPTVTGLAGTLDDHAIAEPGAEDRSPTLGLGLKNDANKVADVQRFLNTLPNNHLEVNGRYDNAMSDIVRVYKQHRGIDEPGWGPKCWAQARKEIAAR